MTDTEQSFETTLRDEIAPRVKSMTLGELPAFTEDVMSRKHDYGSVCVAIGGIAAAAAWACNNHPNGNITGFQAGTVFWEFAKAWGSPRVGDCGACFLDYEDLLFPQYERRFTAIPKGVMDAVRKRAAKELADNEEETDPGLKAHPDVVAHWQALADGVVPFGLRVED